jgi:hypothetical protein
LSIQLLLLAVVVASMTACSRPTGPAPAATYDPETGRLTRLSTDTNGNGTFDTVSIMDGARIVRIELDLDENGGIERWDFYTPEGRLEKVGLSRENDGVMDALAFYGPSGELVRMEISSARDGTFDRVEYYEGGELVRSTDDTNRDGRPDKWDVYAVAGGGADGTRYTVTSTALDESGSGRAERRFVFGAGGAIERVEVDPDGDGIFTEERRRP